MRLSFLLLNREVDSNSLDPPLPIVIVIGRPPQLLSDALPLLWWVQNARCMHIHTFWRLRRAVSRI